MKRAFSVSIVSVKTPEKHKVGYSTFTILHTTLTDYHSLAVLETTLLPIILVLISTISILRLGLIGLQLLIKGHRIVHLGREHPHVHELHTIAAVESGGNILRVDVEVGQLSRHSVCHCDRMTKWIGISLKAWSLLESGDNGLLLTAVLASRQFTAMAIVDGAGWNTAQASIVVVKVLLSVSLGRRNVGRDSIRILHRRNVVGRIG